MIPVKKKFKLQNALPFHINYQQTKSLQHELPEHTHDWFEIVMIHKGNGTFFIDQTFYNLEKDDIIIIPSNTIHRTLPDKDYPLTSTAIFFSPALINHTTFGNSFAYLKIFEETKREKNYKYSLTEKHISKLNDHVNTIVNEVETENPDQVNAILLWLHMILLHLNRHCLTSKEVTNQSSFGPEWFKNSLIHIDQNLEGNLDLNSLSKHVSVSPAHFSRVFKQLIGLNVTEYIAIKRILHAKDLLSSHNEKITTIAEKCGFSSMPHFFRTFKRHTSMTPSDYRKKVNSDKMLD